MRHFVFYTIIFILCVGTFITGYFLQERNECLSNLNRLQYSVFTSRGAGLVLAVFFPFLVLSSCKYTITFLRNYSKIIRHYFPENTMMVHKTLGSVIAFFGIIHTVSHYVNFYTAEILNIAPTELIHHRTYAGISGHTMVSSMLVMLTFSISYFKIKLYEVFFYTHHLYILVYGAFMFHSMGCFVKTNNGSCLPYYSNYLYSLPLLIYAVEKIYDSFKKRVKIKDVEFIGQEKDVCKISFDKCMSYKPGQYINVVFPDYNKFQYHPFTLISCEEIDKEKMTIAIKDSGNWTRNVLNLLKENQDREILISGPFASSSDIIYDYDSVVLVSTGIGITPFISILKSLTHRYATNSLSIKKITVIFVNNKNEQYDWFNEAMTVASNIIPSNILDFNIFLTEKFSMDEINIIVKEDLNHMKYYANTKILINYGRPDFVKILQKVLKEKVTSNIGVFSCSNESTNRSITRACDLLSSKNIKLDFYKEEFY